MKELSHFAVKSFHHVLLLVITKTSTVDNHSSCEFYLDTGEPFGVTFEQLRVKCDQLQVTEEAKLNS